MTNTSFGAVIGLPTRSTLVIGHDHDVGHPFADAANLVGQLPNARIEKARFLGEMRLFPDG